MSLSEYAFGRKKEMNENLHSGSNKSTQVLSCTNVYHLHFCVCPWKFLHTTSGCFNDSYNLCIKWLNIFTLISF